MLHLEYSLRTEKKNTSAQKHIYHKHMTCNMGNISSSGKQPSGPVPFVSAPVSDLLDRWRYKAFLLGVGIDYFF